MSEAAEYERQRLQRLAAESSDSDEVRCEWVYGPRVVTFRISAMECQHLSREVLWTRYVSEAFAALHVPAPVVADTTEDRTVVGVGNP